MSDGEVPEITVLELKERLDADNAPVLVDVREYYEADIADLPEVGQLRIPMAELMDRMDEMDKESELVLYCRSGARSDRAVRHLLRHGYTKVSNLKGGMLAWRKEVDPDIPSY
ncbi:MAG: rhodanese-like domain-containing protein [Gemmatimonadota bacterium]|jgi:adenylyltransferase/sulfurtransferase